MKEIANLSRVFSRDPEFFPHLLVMQFGQSFRSFHAEAVQVQILGVLSTFEQALGFNARLGPDSDQ